MFDLFYDGIFAEPQDVTSSSDSVRDNLIKKIESAQHELRPYPSDSPEWDSSSKSMYQIILATARAE